MSLFAYDNNASGGRQRERENMREPPPNVRPQSSLQDKRAAPVCVCVELIELKLNPRPAKDGGPNLVGRNGWNSKSREAEKLALTPARCE